MPGSSFVLNWNSSLYIFICFFQSKNLHVACALLINVREKLS